MRNPDDAWEALRRLVRQNPKEARRQVQAILAGGPADRDAFLASVGGVGDGRLRQCVANVVIASPALLPTAVASLQGWLPAETDEFTRRAIAAALERTGVRAPARKAALFDPALVDAYRYVSDRLAHELRNSLLVPQGRLGELRGLVAALGEDRARARILACLGRLEDEFREVGRLTEGDPGDEYFRLRPIKVVDWLDRMGSAYARRYSALGFEASGPVAPAAKVVANDYLLRLVFWNLWLNAHQAVGSGCRVVVEFTLEADKLRLVVLDNGAGFPADAVGAAFRDRFSKHGGHRGRGLLEVQEAVERLHGTAELVEHPTGTYRVSLVLPACQT